ncbi:MAG: J domain-containing protein [Actinobacteria bacterium]|nr:J domain-containing protein [Actinomycetota bacterium]
MAPSYYDVLGVPANASAEAIRRAYRGGARELHPDRRTEASPEESAAAARAMQQLNEAWRVLGDPVRRSHYDRALADAARAARPVHPVGDEQPYPRPPAEPEDVGVAVTVVRGLPWVVMLTVLLLIFVFTAFAGGGSDGRPSASDLVGRCVEVQPGSEIRAVPCAEPNDGRVDLVAVRSSLCPSGAAVVRMPGERSWLCLRDPTTD